MLDIGRLCMSSDDLRDGNGFVGLCFGRTDGCLCKLHAVNGIVYMMARQS